MPTTRKVGQARTQDFQKGGSEFRVAVRTRRATVVVKIKCFTP